MNWKPFPEIQSKGTLQARETMNMLSASDGSVTDFSGHYRYRVVASENPDLTRQKHFHTSWLVTNIFTKYPYVSRRELCARVKCYQWLCDITVVCIQLIN
jgi:hypothetical protein